MRALPILAVLLVVACGGQEYGAPCGGDDDCERKLECLSTRDVPLSAVGGMCTNKCDASSDDCNCWFGTCVRECEVTAPDCPDGSICAVLESTVLEPQGYCVLPCASADECGGAEFPFPFCPEVGGPCSRYEGEVPPWNAATP